MAEEELNLVKDVAENNGSEGVFLGDDEVKKYLAQGIRKPNTERMDKLLRGIAEGKGFNVCAFFLGAPYLAYRKLYKQAFWCALICFIPGPGVLISGLVAGVLFYPLYKEKIEKDAWDCGVDFHRENSRVQIDKFMKKGGVSILSAVMCALVCACYRCCFRVVFVHISSEDCVDTQA